MKRRFVNRLYFYQAPTSARRRGKIVIMCILPQKLGVNDKLSLDVESLTTVFKLQTASKAEAILTKAGFLLVSLAMGNAIISIQVPPCRPLY